MIIDALRKKYEADIAHAKANIEVYLKHPVGIGEHPDLVEETVKLFEDVAHADGLLETIKKVTQ